MHLPRRLVDKRQETVEGHTAHLHHVGSQRIAVVGKVARKHSSKMQITARGRVELAHVVAHTRGKTFEQSHSVGVACLKEYRNYREIHNARFREGLHGIQHSISDGMALEDVNRHTTCGVNEHCIIATTA